MRCSTPDNAEEPYRANFSETEKLGEASRAAFGILEVHFRAEKYGVPYFLAEREAKQNNPRKEAAGARARNAPEDLNVQVIRSYSWAAAEGSKNPQCKPVNNCSGRRDFPEALVSSLERWQPARRLREMKSPAASEISTASATTRNAWPTSDPAHPLGHEGSDQIDPALARAIMPYEMEKR